MIQHVQVLVSSLQLCLLLRISGILLEKVKLILLWIWVNVNCEGMQCELVQVFWLFLALILQGLCCVWVEMELGKPFQVNLRDLLQQLLWPFCFAFLLLQLAFEWEVLANFSLGCLEAISLKVDFQDVLEDFLEGFLVHFQDLLVFYWERIICNHNTWKIVTARWLQLQQQPQSKGANHEDPFVHVVEWGSWLMLWSMKTSKEFHKLCHRWIPSLTWWTQL